MPMQRNLYPRNWPQIARRLKEAADWTCQLCGAKRGEKCKNRHGEWVDVQIGVMHPNHDPWNLDARLVVACRQCHITYDAKDARRKRIMMAIARGQLVLPGLQGWYPAPRQRQSGAVRRRRRTARPITRQQGGKGVVRA